VTFERAAIAAPATRPDAATTSGSAPAPPRTENERTMVALWEEVLGVSPVGVSDNFFDLGGNSLMALKVVSRLTRATGGAVSLTSIFEAPTPRALALLLRDADDQTIVDASRSRGAQRRRQANRRVPLETSEPA
jgi:aryl carrier-like protein